MIGEFEPQVGEDRGDGRPEAERPRLLDRGGFLTRILARTHARIGDRDVGIEQSPDVTEQERHELQADPEPDQQRIARDVDRPVRVTHQAAHMSTPKRNTPVDLVRNSSPRITGRRVSTRVRPPSAAATSRGCDQNAERHKGARNGEASRPRQLPGRQRQIGAATDAVGTGRRCARHRHARKDGGDAEGDAAGRETVSSMRS